MATEPYEMCEENSCVNEAECVINGQFLCKEHRPASTLGYCSVDGCLSRPEFVIFGKAYCSKHKPGTLPGTAGFVNTNPYQQHQPEALKQMMQAQQNAVGSGEHKISKESLIAMRKRLNEKADSLLLAKGNDYNAQQQDAGDTLFNLRICAILGIVSSPVDGILVRMSDKLARLVSLTRPTTVQKVKDESLEDTVVDLRNYADYLLAMVKESKGQEIK